MALSCQATPHEGPAQVTRPGRYPVPLNPGDLPEFQEAGLVQIRDLNSGASWTIREPLEGATTQVLTFLVLVDEAGRFGECLAASEGNDPRLAAIVEAALPQMGYEPARGRRRPIASWARWQFVFQEQTL